MTSLETEVKIYHPNLAELAEKLDQLGAELVHERTYEHNIRYDVEGGTYTAQGIVVRLREDGHARLTYKSPGSVDKGIITREELEVEVSDFETMDTILGKLGLLSAMVYEKYRTTYHLDNTEIVLDELPYGNFFEVEGSAEAIEAVLGKLGLENAERRGDSYAKIFEHVKHHLDLEFRDLTFENFADITVPESAFIPPGSIVIR